MNAQGGNDSSEVIEERGIRILDGINEMRPDEKNSFEFF